MLRRGQSSVEYALFIAALTAALAMAGLYVKRGVQGRTRGIANDLSGGSYYDPGQMSSSSSVSKSVNEVSSTVTTKLAGSSGSRNQRITDSSVQVTTSQTSSKTESANSY